MMARDDGDGNVNKETSSFQPKNPPQGLFASHHHPPEGEHASHTPTPLLTKDDDEERRRKRKRGSTITLYDTYCIEIGQLTDLVNESGGAIGAECILKQWGRIRDLIKERDKWIGGK